MFDSVSYQVIVCAVGNGSGSHRVARQTGGADGGPVVVRWGTFAPDKSGNLVDDGTGNFPQGTIKLQPDGWIMDSSITPEVWKHDDDREYYRAFYWYQIKAPDGEVQRADSYAGAKPENQAHDALKGGPWVEVVKVFYRWNYGHGGGNNAISIDAFNNTTGLFVGDNFVSVEPDDDEHTLTKIANDGYIDSDTQITKKETITALDIDRKDEPDLQFLDWRSSEDQHADIPPNPPKPEDRKIVVHPSDIVDSIARYVEITPPEPSWHSFLPWAAAFDPFWIWRTAGGRLPVGPLPGPPIDFARPGSQLDATRVMLEAVSRLPEHLQARGFGLVADSLDHTSDNLRTKARAKERSERSE